MKKNKSQQPNHCLGLPSLLGSLFPKAVDELPTLTYAYNPTTTPWGGGGL